MTQQSAQTLTIRDTRSANWFWADNKAVDELLPILAPTNFSIYITLCRIAGDKSQCNPSVNTLAKRTGLSVDTIRRGLRKLVELNIVAISRENINGLDTPNTYTLLSLSKVGSFKTSTDASTSTHASTSIRASTSKQPAKSVVLGIAPVLVQEESLREEKKESKKEDFKTKTPLPPQAGDVVVDIQPSVEQVALQVKIQQPLAIKPITPNRQGIQRDVPNPPATPEEIAIAIRVIQRWIDTHGIKLRLPPQPGDMYFNCVVSRLRDGYKEQDLYDAIAGCLLDDFSMGRSEKGTKKWNDLTLICRMDQDKKINKVQYFINICDQYSGTSGQEISLARPNQLTAQPKQQFRMAMRAEQVTQDFEDLGKLIIQAKQAKEKTQVVEGEGNGY